MDHQLFLNNGGSNLAALQQQQAEARRLINELLKQEHELEAAADSNDHDVPNSRMANGSVQQQYHYQQQQQQQQQSQSLKRKAEEWLPAGECPQQKMAQLHVFSNNSLGNGARGAPIGSAAQGQGQVVQPAQADYFKNVSHPFSTSPMDLALMNALFMDNNNSNTACTSGIPVPNNTASINTATLTGSGNQSAIGGISQVIRSFVKQNPVGGPAVRPMKTMKTQHQIQPKYALSSLAADSFDIDLSWANPVSLKEHNASESVLQPARSILYEKNLEKKAPSTTTFELDPQKVRENFLSTTPSNSEPSTLHQSAKLFPNNVSIIQGAVDLNHNEIRRKAPIPEEPPAQSSSSLKKHAPPKPLFASKASYGYPLNIALQNDASLGVVSVLAQAAPEVIAYRDGKDQCGSLALLLRRWSPAKVPIFDALINANPLSLRMVDRRRNTPLHIAVSRALGIDIVRALCELYPAALLQTNLNGETPLQVAQRTSMCTEAELNFVHAAFYQELLRSKSESSKSEMEAS